jgi:hypothetical protein
MKTAAARNHPEPSTDDHPGLYGSAPPDAGLLRLGATAGLLGIAVQVVMDRLHPHQVHPNDSVAVFREYERSGIWTMVHIGQFFGTLLIVVALLVLARQVSRQSGLAGGLAVLGAATAVVTAAVFAVQMAVDGVALKAAIDTWTGASGIGRASAFQVAEGVRATEKGLGGFFQLTNGVTLCLLGLSMAVAAGWPRWLGWVGVAGGAGFVAGGALTATTGFSDQASLVLLPALVLTLVFVIGTSVSMWRRASPKVAARPG